jgi:hypothetical protein
MDVLQYCLIPRSKIVVDQSSMAGKRHAWQLLATDDQGQLTMWLCRLSEPFSCLLESEVINIVMMLMCSMVQIIGSVGRRWDEKAITQAEIATTRRMYARNQGETVSILLKLSPCAGSSLFTGDLLKLVSMCIHASP